MIANVVITLIRGRGVATTVIVLLPFYYECSLIGTLPCSSSLFWLMVEIKVPYSVQAVIILVLDPALSLLFESGISLYDLSTTHKFLHIHIFLKKENRRN